MDMLELVASVGGFIITLVFGGILGISDYIIANPSLKAETEKD